jgi:hypothetical protein
MSDEALNNYQTMLFVTRGSILGSSRLSAEMSRYVCHYIDDGDCIFIYIYIVYVCLKREHH